MSEDKEKVCCAMPCRTIPDHRAFRALQVAAAAYGAPFDTPAREPRERNRNTCVRQFLDLSNQFDWLLFVDDDTVVPPDVIERLLAVKQQIAVGVQPLLLSSNGTTHLVANITPFPTTKHTRPWWPDWVTWEVPSEPFPIVFCGFGCVLLHRDILVKMGFPWFREEYGNERGDLNITEDIYFCEKARRAGFDIWCVPDVVCGHYKTVDLRDIVPRSRVVDSMTG